MRHQWISFAFAGALFLAGMFPASVHAASCTGVNHSETVTIYADASPVSGAIITFYQDAARQVIADNIAVTGLNDATVTTNANGSGVVSLYAGTYYLRIIKSGYQTYEPSVVVPADGTCGSANYSLTTSSQLGLSLENTTVTVSPSTIAADGVQTATVTMQVRNVIGSVMPNQAVDLQTTLAGMFITHNAATTDASGIATFTVRATIEGNADLMPYVNGQLVKPTILVVSNALGSATSTSALVSATSSQIEASPVLVAADGVDASIVTITVNDQNGTPLSGVSVSPRTTLLGSGFSPASAVTDAQGRAIFSFTSTASGLATVTAVAGSIGLSDRPNVQFGLHQGTSGTANTPSGTTGSGSSGVPALEPASALRGDLIKLPDDGDPRTAFDTTVYYVGNDDMRHAFPDEKTYFSWYADYANLRIVSAATMASVPLGANVTYRPGIKLIKFPSDPKVYAVQGKNQLRWVTSASLAAQWYGSDWAHQVNDLSEAFAASYTFGADISDATAYTPSRETQLAPTIESVLGK